MVDRINVTKVSFKCNNCGKCCRLRGDIVLYPMDIIRISNFLNISCKDFLEKYTITLESSTILSQIVIKSKNDKFLTCVFLNKKNMCRIYEVRPIACSNFPFLILNENTYLVQMVPCVQDFNNGSKVIDFLMQNPRFLSEKKLRRELDELISLVNKKCENLEWCKKIIFKFLYLGYNSKKDVVSQVKRRITLIKVLIKLSVVVT